MSKKHNGVKKGSAQALTYAKRREAERDTEASNSKFGGQIETMDMMVVAIARMSPRYRRDWFRRLNASYREVREEYRGMIERQAEFDKETGTGYHFEEIKVRMDRELKAALGDDFCGWDTRWEPRRYSEGLAAYEPNYERSCYWTEEDERKSREASEWTLQVGVKHG